MDESNRSKTEWVDIEPMNASAVVAALEKLIHEHGDLPVTFYADGNSKVMEVVAYDQYGETAEKRVEFHLHGV
jgi:RIO-like serine/threonine protein kinase